MRPIFLVRNCAPSAAKVGLRSQLQKHLGDWLRLPLDQITKGMVVARHAELHVIPSRANNTLLNFRSVWNHARRTHDLLEAPTLAIEWHPEEPDGRIIKNLPEWYRVVDELENPIHAAYCRLLLFTGFRKSEALALRWKDVHSDRIHLPMTENGRPFDLPIVDLHHELLEPMRGLSSEWMFSAPKSATGHLEILKRLNWPLHAHRRTFATVSGVSTSETDRPSRNYTTLTDVTRESQVSENPQDRRRRTVTSYVA